METSIIYSFVDELQKIATSKWRSLMRAGELLPENIKTLENSGLLNYAKETAGLNRGTGNILKSLGVTEVVPSVRGSIKQLISSPSKENLKNVGTNLKTQLFTIGMGGAYVPSIQKSFTSPTAVKLRLHPEDVDATYALVRRHEADEARAAARVLPEVQKTLKAPRQFIPMKNPRTLNEKFNVAVTDKLRSAGLLDKIYEMASGGKKVTPEVRESLRSFGVPDPGKIMAGKHFSPFPITEESKNVAMLHPSVKKSLSPLRMGETDTLGPYGFEYGKEVTPQNLSAINKAFKEKKI